VWDEGEKKEENSFAKRQRETNAYSAILIHSFCLQNKQLDMIGIVSVNLTRQTIHLNIYVNYSF
jgi:hypothetical protein